MRQLSRRAVLRAAVAGGGLLGLGLAAGYALLGGPDPAHRPAPTTAVPPEAGARGPMTGGATAADMSMRMDLFSRHAGLRRTVRLIPGGVRAVTDADDPALAVRLQEHAASMYAHLDQGAEATCMSASLPALFRSRRYRRSLSNTARAVAVTETSVGPRITAAIRAHAAEVTGFVDDGMPSMMAGMPGGMTG